MSYDLHMNPKPPPSHPCCQCGSCFLRPSPVASSAWRQTPVACYICLCSSRRGWPCSCPPDARWFHGSRRGQHSRSLEQTGRGRDRSGLWSLNSADQADTGSWCWGRTWLWAAEDRRNTKGCPGSEQGGPEQLWPTGCRSGTSVVPVDGHPDLIHTQLNRKHTLL